MWQKLESIESLAKNQFQYHNNINNKLTILKKHSVTILILLKLQTWAAIAYSKFSVQLRLMFNNKQNKIIVKLNNNTFVEEMKKQALKKCPIRLMRAL